MNRKGRPRIEPESLKKILLVRLRRIGDVVMTTPAVSALKAAFPLTSLAYAVERPFSRLIQGNPAVDETIVLDPEQKSSGFLRLLFRIRKKKYDAVLDFHGGPRASLITLFSGAKVKIGYRVKYKSFIYDLKLPRAGKDGHIHSVENHLNLVRVLGETAGAAVVSTPPPLFLPAALPQEAARIDRFWEDNGLEAGKTVVLHIGAGNEFRDWGMENITHFIRLLEKGPGMRVLLVGAEEDRTVEADILGTITPPPLSLVAGLNLIELREVISRSALFVGPDSGPMHIAASTATPIVAYFGPTLPAHFSPWRARNSLLEKDLDCRPCRQKRCVWSDFRCLRTITPEEVYEAALRFL